MRSRKINLIFLLFLTIWIKNSSAEVQKGLRGVFIYTYDASFVGSDLLAQEVDAQTFDKFLATKEFSSKRKNLASAYDFLALLDGRCDIQLKCEKKECEKVPEPLKCEKCEVCEKCPICPAPKTCDVTTPRTPPTPTTPRKEVTTPKVTPSTPKIRTPTSTPGITYLPVPTPEVEIPEDPTTPPRKITTPPTSRVKTCDNGARNYPDCCLNGGKGRFCCENGADNEDCCKNGGSGQFCCKNGADNEFCCTNGATNKQCKLTEVTTTTTPKQRTPTKPISEKKTTPSKTTPKSRRTTPSRPPPTKFVGLPYLPIATVSTERPPPVTYTTRSYEGTFKQSFTWQPYTHTGTWIPKNFTYGTITTTPKYERKDNVKNGITYPVN